MHPAERDVGKIALGVTTADVAVRSDEAALDPDATRRTAGDRVDRESGAVLVERDRMGRVGDVGRNRQPPPLAQRRAQTELGDRIPQAEEA